MILLLQPSTKREHDDISVTEKLCHECAVFSIIPRVKWVEQRVLLAVKYEGCVKTKFRSPEFRA